MCCPKSYEEEKTMRNKKEEEEGKEWEEEKDIHQVLTIQIVSSTLLTFILFIIIDFEVDTIIILILQIEKLKH